MLCKPTIAPHCMSVKRRLLGERSENGLLRGASAKFIPRLGRRQYPVVVGGGDGIGDPR